MDLKSYFASDGAMTRDELRERIGVAHDAQVRQWMHGYSYSKREGTRRMPSAANSAAIEAATAGAVRRWDLRPNDWWKIWPDLVGADGAPEVPQAQAS